MGTDAREKLLVGGSHVGASHVIESKLQLVKRCCAQVRCFDTAYQFQGFKFGITGRSVDNLIPWP